MDLKARDMLTVACQPIIKFKPCLTIREGWTGDSLHDKLSHHQYLKLRVPSQKLASAMSSISIHI